MKTWECQLGKMEYVWNTWNTTVKLGNLCLKNAKPVIITLIPSILVYILYFLHCSNTLSDSTVLGVL